LIRLVGEFTGEICAAVDLDSYYYISASIGTYSWLPAQWPQTIIPISIQGTKLRGVIQD